jgi:hypothetical protein
MKTPQTGRRNAATLDAMKTKCEPRCSPQGQDACRRCWDLEIEMERLMRLYEACSYETSA